MSNALPPPGYAPVPVPPQQLDRRGYSRSERLVTYGLASGALGGLLIAAVWPVASIDSGQTSCLMQMWTGLPCPGCGMTRSWVHLAHGDVGGAFAYNHFGPLFFAIAAFLVGYVLLALVRRRPPEQVFSLVSPRIMLVGVLFWFAYSLWRMVSLAMGQDTFALVVA